MNKVIIDVIICAVWLAGCIFLITRVNEGKVGKIIAASFLFIIFAALTAGSSFGLFTAEQKIDEGSVFLEEFLADNYKNNALVRDGVDVSRAPEVIDGLEPLILDNVNKLGAKGFVAIEVYKIAGRSAFKSLRTKTDILVEYAEEDGSGKITIKTILNVVKDQIINRVKIIALIIHLIAYLFMAIHIVRLLLAWKKPRGPITASA